LCDAQACTSMQYNFKLLQSIPYDEQLCRIYLMALTALYLGFRISPMQSLLCWCSRRVTSSTHLHCAPIKNAILTGEASFALTHEACCWGYQTLTCTGPCSLGPLDDVVVDVVASLQQKSAGSQQLDHGMQVVTIGRHQFMRLRTSQVKMLDCCLHWHC